MLPFFLASEGGRDAQGEVFKPGRVDKKMGSGAGGAQARCAQSFTHFQHPDWIFPPSCGSGANIVLVHLCNMESMCMKASKVLKIFTNKGKLL